MQLAVPEVGDRTGEARYAAGEAIVRFESGTAPTERRSARRRAQVSFDRVLRVPRAQVVEVDGSVPAAVRRLERQPGVAYAQPNFRYEALAVPMPNDTFFDELWGLSAPPGFGVDALEAWESSRGAGQVIAVIDTGVDLTHPDLSGNLWTNPDSSALDVHGYDFVDDDSNPDDFNFHGSHVAGTAAAVDGNAQGIAGVSPDAEIMAVRVLDGNGSGSTETVAEGIAYAATNGADVINLSLGASAGGAGDTLMAEEIATAGASGAVVVAAAGNDGADNDNPADATSPCTLPPDNLICVAAVDDRDGGLAQFSNYGETSVDLAAPGRRVLSAKTEYGSLLSEGFNEASALEWSASSFNGGKTWGLTGPASEGAHSAADSPGEDYGSATLPGTEEEPLFAEAWFDYDNPMDLTSERGCRIHFDVGYDIEPPSSDKDGDDLVVGAWNGSVELADPTVDGSAFAGTTPGFDDFDPAFVREEVAVNGVDGLDDVTPFLGLVSDTGDERDGAYVDRLRLICRRDALDDYDDAIAIGPTFEQSGTGSYVRFSGTSMATPHVAGIAALIRGAVPDASAPEIVEAILAGVRPIPTPDPERPTATNGIADACRSIGFAMHGDAEVGCVDTSEEPDPEPDPEPEPESDDSSSESSTQEGSAPDTRAPNTGFARRPRRVVWTPWRFRRVFFRFRSNEQGVEYLCNFDRRPTRRCGPQFLRWFRVGRHVLRVSARDRAGNVDRTPAIFRFVVRRIPRR